MKKILLSFDFFSPSPTLYIKMKERQQTFLGVFVTLSAYGIVAFFAVYFFVKFLDGEEMYINSSKINSFNSTFNLSEKIFFYQLMFSNGTKVPGNIANIVPVYWTITDEYTSKSILDTHDCNHSDNQKFDQLFTFNISQYNCLSSNNLTLRSQTSPTLSQYVNLYVVKCNDLYGNSECSTEEEIDQVLEYNPIFFTFFIETINVDHNDKKEPLKKDYANYQYKISNDFSYIIYQSFRKYEYRSDEGSIFSSIKEYSTFSFEKGERVEEVSARGMKTAYGDTMMLLQYSSNDDYSQRYSRTYAKFQTFLASLGGISNFMINIAKYALFFLSKGIMYQDIVQETKKKLNKKEKELKKNSDFSSSIRIKNSMNNLHFNSSFSEVKLLQKSKFFIQKEIEKKNSTNIIIKDKKFQVIQHTGEYHVTTCEHIAFRLFFCFKKSHKFQYVKESENFIKKRMSCEEIIKNQILLESILGGQTEPKKKNSKIFNSADIIGSKPPKNLSIFTQ